MTIEELIDEKTKLEKLVIQLAGENQQLKDKLSAKKASDTPFADLLETWLHNKAPDAFQRSEYAWLPSLC